MYYCSVNGQKSQLISVKDRGLAYGDGIFTTAKISHGKVLLFDEHFARLKEGCLKLGLLLPDFANLAHEVSEQAEAYDIAVLKIMITSGEGGRGYSRQGIEKANTIIQISPFPEHYGTWQSKGIRLGISQQLLGINPLLAGIKHLNRLEQVMIRQELDRQVWDDMAVANVYGHIVETCCANIFWLSNGQLYTPDLTDSGVAGIMRAQVLDSMPMIQKVKATIDELDAAESIFICNSLMGLVPVRQYKDRELKIKPVLEIQAILKETLA